MRGTNESEGEPWTPKVGKFETSEGSQSVFFPRMLEGETCKEIEMGVTFRGVKNWVPSGTGSEKELGSFPPLFPVWPGALIVSFSSRFLCHCLWFRTSRGLGKCFSRRPRRS